MDVQRCIDAMLDHPNSRQTVDAVRSLASYTHESRVMDALCEVAVVTDNIHVREASIEALKSNPAGAQLRFSDIALWSDNPIARKWALVDLSLMGCCDAKDAVISGLYDPDAAVRKAAAMSAGLYTDADVLNALEHYFESHRFSLTLTFLEEGVRAVRGRTRPVEIDDRSRIVVDAQPPGALPDGGH